MASWRTVSNINTTICGCGAVGRSHTHQQAAATTAAKKTPKTKLRETFFGFSRSAGRFMSSCFFRASLREIVKVSPMLGRLLTRQIQLPGPAPIPGPDVAIVNPARNGFSSIIAPFPGEAVPTGRQDLTDQGGDLPAIECVNHQIDPLRWIVNSIIPPSTVRGLYDDITALDQVCQPKISFSQLNFCRFSL